MPAKSRELSQLEQTCVSKLPPVLLPLLSHAKACPCSVLAIYRDKGLRAAEEYLEKLK
jgi:hypothetical protein